jgi:hypothetical protein
MIAVAPSTAISRDGDGKLSGAALATLGADVLDSGMVGLPYRLKHTR